MTSRLKLLGAAALAGLFLSTAAYAADCAKGPVTVGFLPKLDTDPYFQVAKTGAEEAAGEIGGDAQGTVIGLLLIVSLFAGSTAERLFERLPFGRAPLQSGD